MEGHTPVGHVGNRIVFRIKQQQLVASRIEAAPFHSIFWKLFSLRIMQWELIEGRHLGYMVYQEFFVKGPVLRKAH